MENRTNKKILIILLIATFFYFIANFQRIAIPGAIFDVLTNDLSVSAFYVTAFGAVYMYIYAFSQLITGVLVDRFGGFRVILAGAIILFIGCLLFPLTSNLPVMYLSRALVGVGSSTFYLSIIRELKNVCSDKNFGIGISVVLFIGYTGGIMANAPFVALMQVMTWREILITMAVVILIALIIFTLILTTIPLPRVNKTIKIRVLPFRLVLHKRHNLNLFSFACCNFGISYVIQTVIGKKFIEDFCSIPPSKSAMILSIMAIIATCFNIINAFVCKICHNHRVQFLKIASLITLSSLVALCLIIYLNIKTYFIAIILFIIAGNASLTSILVPILYMTNRKMISGTAVSIMNFCFFMMVGILGTITGFLLELTKPQRIGDTLVYSNNAYLLIFGMFLMLSIYEVYKVSKLSNKY